MSLWKCAWMLPVINSQARCLLLTTCLAWLHGPNAVFHQLKWWNDYGLLLLLKVERQKSFFFFFFVERYQSIWFTPSFLGSTDIRVIVNINFSCLTLLEQAREVLISSPGCQPAYPLPDLWAPHWAFQERVSPSASLSKEHLYKC